MKDLPEMSRIPFPPELLLFMGIDLFVALSLLAALVEKAFPTALPYFYHVAALAGFGQIWVNYAFLLPFEEARFWSCLLYLFAALLNVGGVNFYIAFRRGMISVAGMFLSLFTIPSFSISLFFVSAFVNGVSISMPWLPLVPLESLYVVLAICMVILGLSIIAYIEPSMLKKRAAKKLDVAVGPVMTPLVRDKEKKEVKTNE